MIIQYYNLDKKIFAAKKILQREGMYEKVEESKIQ